MSIDEHVCLIAEFRLFEKGSKKLFIDTEKLIRINKGKRTSSDLVNLFGLPIMRTIEKTKESWYY